MLIRSEPQAQRQPKTETQHADLIVVGGGMAGTCCAITAARQGLRVVLVQDRPVLGGNASSEVRLWVLGATCHMGSNNRWSREGGVLDEIIVENLWRNPEGNALIFDTIVLEWVSREPNITLLLNTAAFEVTKHADDVDKIKSVRAFCSQNSTLYDLHAPLFCDASGDGIVGFCAGAAFRMGAEAREEFDEPFAPTGEFGQLLGHSIYFYSKDTGRPVNFVAPSFAINNVEELIPRYKQFNARDHGCNLWWIEWGGRLDTVHESERIKWELWRVAYGVWDYIKNSGKFPDADNLALEWVGHIPGKRESRRFEGDYMLTQHDVVERRLHPDAVAFGGWSIDLHPADGVYSNLAGSHHLHSKGPYQIPYRCYYSRNVRNLYFAGRIMSSSHVAFGSTRVIATCCLGAQAVAHAAALCVKHRCLPRDVNEASLMRTLQTNLMRDGHHIWSMSLDDPDDLARQATVTCSSQLQLQDLPAGGAPCSLREFPVAQLLPLPAGPVPTFTLLADVSSDTTLLAELRTTSRADHFTPDVTLASVRVELRAGAARPVTLNFDTTLDRAVCAFVYLHKNDSVTLHTSPVRVTGLLRLAHRRDEKTSHVGGEDFPVLAPPRRPGGENLALRLAPPLDRWPATNVTTGVYRPTHQPNCWVADVNDPAPSVTLTWPTPQTLARVVLCFDVDFDHAMESCLRGHPERVVPFVVKRFQLNTGDGIVLHTCDENHQGRVVVTFDQPVRTRSLRLHILEMNGQVPATVFGIRCYATT